MNPITFNDPLIQFAESSECKDKTEITRMMQSPLVKWEEPSANDFNVNDNPECRFSNGCPRLPFERFRVDGFYHYLGPGWMKFKAWLRQDGIGSDKLGYSIVIQITGSEEGRETNLRSKDILVIASALFEKENTKVKWIIACFHCKTKQTHRPGLDADKIWNLCAEWVMKLAIDFLNPHFYLCKKHPPIPQGKSILWAKAREHFVLLHKSHSANNRESVGRHVIQDGQTVDRVAHSRRAHFRMLRSPKFKHKQGQRIWIQSAWVGPKEWSDKSGQIYRIVDRKQPI